jgi:hypothetical protein
VPAIGNLVDNPVPPSRQVAGSARPLTLQETAPIAIYRQQYGTA